ncbi:unnamed protein product [Orchesella dallaii]|uniref:Uncharacterized protein n=1 Tax=Orchesella dallaii TaxID=48710 RepID=A0ABP1Q425_9HEXA
MTPHFVKHKSLQQLLLLASTCTFHYVKDNSGNMSRPFDSLFELSYSHQHLHLLTTDRADRYLVQNATHNNWYLNNTYQNGFFQGRKYKRGYWELFKLSKYSAPCQLQVVDVQNNWKQLLYYLNIFLLRRYGNAAPTPNYILLILSKPARNFASFALRQGYSRIDVYTDENLFASERIIKVRAPLPIFCFANEKIYFVPFVLTTNFQLKDLDMQFTGYILPFRDFEIQNKMSSLHFELYWKKKYLLENNKFKYTRTFEQIIDGSNSFPKWNTAKHVLRINTAENSLEYQLTLFNLSTIYLQRRQLHGDKHSKNFLVLIKQHPYIFRYGLTFEGFRYAVFVDITRIENKFLVNLKGLLLPLSTELWGLAVFTLGLIAVITYTAGHSRPVFNTFAILVEQGDVALQKKFSLVITISMLFFLGFILRLSYTSSMYSHLTVEPKYKVPQSLEEGVLNDNYYKLAEPHIVSGVFLRMSYEYSNTTQKYTVTRSTHQLLRNLAKKIYSLELLPMFFEMDVLEYENFSAESQLTSLANHNNTLFVETYRVSTPLNPEKFQNYDVGPFGSELVVADKFVYIFSDPVDVKHESTGGDLFNIILFGNKTLFKNNEPSVFHTMNGYFAMHDLATEMAEDIVGKLEQAGILRRWKRFDNFLWLLTSWKETMGWPAFRDRFKFNIVQVAYDFLEDLGLAERIGRVMSDTRFEAATNRALATVWLLFSLLLLQVCWSLSMK